MRFVEPNVVTSQFHLRDGDTVGDFGAGGGYFLTPLSQAVGRGGTVYALEIQKPLVEALGEQARRDNLSNVRVLWADLEEPNGTTLEANTLDAAIVVNTYFQFEDKEGALKEVLRSLRSGGKFFLIDWTESFGNLGPEPNAVVPEGVAQSAAESVGFVFERHFPAGDHHYGLAFRKP
jgi:arsenite methyltransferase